MIRSSLLIITLLIGTNVLFAQFNTVQNGDWDDCSTWGTCPGTTLGIHFPDRDANVTIAHTVTVNSTLDNAAVETQPNAEAISGVCGCTGSGTAGCQDITTMGCGANAFFHNGTITINNGGALTSTVQTAFRGDVEINSGGSFRLNANSITFVIGRVDVRDGGTFISNQNLAVSGDGILNIEAAATAGIGDDLYMDGDNSFVCGAGMLELNGPAYYGGVRNNSIRPFNSTDGATLDQFCSETTILCNDGDCCGGQCSGGSDIDTQAGPGDGTVAPGDGTADSNSVLPVELLQFLGREVLGVVRLEWATASELNNEGFEIHRSTDGIDFHQIAFVSGAGNSRQQLSYSFEDHASISGANYYKLIQRDFDGASEDLGTIRVFANATNEFMVYPNPAIRDAHVVLGNQFLNTTTSIRLYNLFGEIVMDKTEWITERTVKIALDGLPGIYFIEVANGTYRHRTQIISK